MSAYIREVVPGSDPRELLFFNLCSVNPYFISLTGSVTAGYFLSHLLFLSKFYNFQRFFKTDDYFKTRLRLKKNQIYEAKKILKEMGFISVSVEGYPAICWYEINLNKIGVLLAKEKLELSSNPCKFEFE